MTSGPVFDPWAGILDLDETVLWQGAPDGRFALQASHILMGAFGLFFAGFALFWMVMAAQAGGFFWMFGLLHFGVGLGIAFGIPVWTTLLRRSSFYTLTNRRAFIATNMPFVGRKLASYPITPETNLIFSDGDLGSIHFATRMSRTKRGLREDQIGFERLANAQEVYALMRQVQRGAKP